MSRLMFSLSSWCEISTSISLFVYTVKYLATSVIQSIARMMVQMKEITAPKKVGSVKSLGSLRKISRRTKPYFIFY